MSEKVSLASSLDTNSFLLPVLGFADRADADRYCEEIASERFTLADRYEPLHLSTRSYVPLSGISGDMWDTMTALNMPLFSKPIWAKLRDKNTLRPGGGYNLALMVDGVRSFYRSVPHSAKIPSYVYRMVEGRRDCYAAWSGFDGRDLIPVVTTGDGANPGAPRGRVFAARSGRGVLYSRVANYSSSGEFSGYTLRVVQVEFSVLDRDPARDDMMRIRVSKQIAQTYKPYDHPVVSKDGLDDAWVKLIERAEAGFNQWCRETPEDVEAWRKVFMEQKTKAAADRELSHSGERASSFRHQVSAMEWRDALAAVKEAWQLQVVVDVHCDSKFDSSVHRCDSNGHRVGVMLSRVESAKRRAELQQMVSDFVAPCDKLWSYTGD